ncbi:hypothetical protein E3E34_11355, partial [Thermococcus sp. GR4]|nr:hypothetical protein [Thermococcus sp. GR4]
METVEAQSIVSLFLLLAFLGVNLWLSFTRLMKRVTGKLFRRALRVDLPENEKKTLERLFTPIWIAVGLYGAWKVRWDY